MLDSKSQKDERGKKQAGETPGASLVGGEKRLPLWRPRHKEGQCPWFGESARFCTSCHLILHLATLVLHPAPTFGADSASGH